METIKLEIPRSAPYVSLARKAVQSICSSIRLPADQIADLELAVGEACTNAVKFGCSESRSVFVQYTISPEALEVEVRNAGPAFHWEKPILDDLSLCDLQEGGLGLYLIERIADELDVRCESGVTTVRFTKKLTPDDLMTN